MNIAPRPLRVAVAARGGQPRVLGSVVMSAWLRPHWYESRTSRSGANVREALYRDGRDSKVSSSNLSNDHRSLGLGLAVSRSLPVASSTSFRSTPDVV